MFQNQFTQQLYSNPQQLKQYNQNMFNLELERNIRESIKFESLRNYDNIINKARYYLNDLLNNSLLKDSNNIYLNINSENLINSFTDCKEIENKLSTIVSQPIKIIQDTESIVEKHEKEPHIIYLPLFLIQSKIEPKFIFDIYDNTKGNIFYFNLFTYTQYLQERIKIIPDYSLIEKSFIKKFINKFTIHNNSEYIQDWLKYFFQTLRRVREPLVLIGNRDISEEIFYHGIVQQIFGSSYCVTITDFLLENQTINTIVKNKLFIHINHIPEDKENQKKLKDLIEGVLIYDNITNFITDPTKYICQIIFTLDTPHTFFNNFLSSAKIFFIDTLNNINKKLQQPDRISLFHNINNDLLNFSSHLSSISQEQYTKYDNFGYVDLTSKEIFYKRTEISINTCINDSIEIPDKDYATDNELFKSWIIDPSLMKLTLMQNSDQPILDPFHESFERIIPIEERYKHTYIVGETGSGKSELLKTLIMGDIQRNDSSVILLDIHGDLAQSVSRLVKDKERLVLIDPILEENFTPTINIFETNDKSNSNIEQMIQMIVSIINNINTDDKLSGSMLDILENCIPILIQNDNKDFYDLKYFMKIFSKKSAKKDEEFDSSKTKDTYYNTLIKLGRNNKNEFIKEYFNDEFDDVKDATKQAVRRRLNKLLKDTMFTNLINKKSTINLEKEMNTKGKIIIFNIPKSKMLNTHVYYIKFIIGLIQIIALKRADRPEKVRPHTYLYIDEFHNFITPTIKEILTESRKYKLFLTLAHQSISQLNETNLKDIVLENTNVKIIGKCASKTLKLVNDSLNVKLKDLDKLLPGEFNLKFGNIDVIKIYNTKRLLDDNEYISEEQWEEYKQYQLDNYYRDLQKNEDENDLSNDDFYTKIKEFIHAIKTRNLEEPSCLANVKIDQLMYEELKDDFAQFRIKQYGINTLFQLAFKQKDLLNTNKITNELNQEDVFGKAEMQTVAEKYRIDGKSQKKYYIIPKGSDL